MKTSDINKAPDSAGIDKKPSKPKTYSIKVSEDAVSFDTVRLNDPVPTGRQILESSGRSDELEYQLFQLLDEGDMEHIRTNETVDLRQRGRERFIAFQSDRVFALRIDNRHMLWGSAKISGKALLALAQPEAGKTVFRDRPGGTDEEVLEADLVNLDGPEMEQFIIASAPPKTFTFYVNTREKTVEKAKITFAEIVALAFPGTHPESVVFSMTFRKAAGPSASGELSDGGVVKLKTEGTVFNVTRTDKS